MSHACVTEENQTNCAKYAEKLLAVDPQNELLRYYLHPVNGEEWRKIRLEFTTRFGAEGFQGEQCVGSAAMANFYANYAEALRKECKEHHLALD